MTAGSTDEECSKHDRSRSEEMHGSDSVSGSNWSEPTKAPIFATLLWLPDGDGARVIAAADNYDVETPVCKQVSYRDAVDEWQPAIWQPSVFNQMPASFAV